MNKLDIVNKIRDFELEEGELFFSEVINIIDNRDFLEWLKTKYPKIYTQVEIFYFESSFRPVGSLKFESSFWDCDMMGHICCGIDSYCELTNDDPCECAEMTYNIVAEYIVEKIDNPLNKLEEGINAYHKKLDSW